MKLYNCKVRLNGSLHNVVGKQKVTAAEIVVLKHIHGLSENAGAPVFDVVPAGEVKRTDQQERARLAATYRLGEVPGAKLIPTLLGVAGVPLPQEYVDEEGNSLEGETKDVTEAEDLPPVRTPSRRRNKQWLVARSLAS
jgi:hypothetical protein